MGTYGAYNKVIENVNVRLDIEHNYVGALVVKLIPPVGNEIILRNQLGGRDRNLNQDYGYLGQNVSDFQTLMGKAASGDWKVSVLDRDAYNDRGILKKIVLSIKTKTGATSTPPPISQAKLYSIGIYEASSNHSFNNHPTADASVAVNTGTDVILALAAYEPVRWNLRVAAGTRVVKVIVSGYHKPEVTGVDASIVEKYCYQECPQAAIGYFYEHPSPNSNSFLSVIKTKTNLDPVSVKKAYNGNTFSIP